MRGRGQGWRASDLKRIPRWFCQGALLPSGCHHCHLERLSHPFPFLRPEPWWPSTDAPFPAGSPARAPAPAFCALRQPSPCGAPARGTAGPVGAPPSSACSRARGCSRVPGCCGRPRSRPRSRSLQGRRQQPALRSPRAAVQEGAWDAGAGAARCRYRPLCPSLRSCGSPTPPPTRHLIPRATILKITLNKNRTRKIQGLWERGAVKAEVTLQSRPQGREAAPHVAFPT